MIAFAYDQEGFYVGPTPRQPSPLEPGVWLIPAMATTIEPPKADGKIAKFSIESQEWCLVDIPASQENPSE